MLQRTHALKGCTLESLNLRFVCGEAGIVREFCFEDAFWSVKYLIAESGNWFRHNSFLCPVVTQDKRRNEEQLAPNIDTIANETKNKQANVRDRGIQTWRSSVRSTCNSFDTTAEPQKSWHENHDLHCTRELNGFQIQTADGVIGHVEDFVIEDESWIVRYLAVSTQTWMLRKQVLVSTAWIERIDKSNSKVIVQLPRETIERAPILHRRALITPDYERDLNRHYDRERVVRASQRILTAASV